MYRPTADVMHYYYAMQFDKTYTLMYTRPTAV